MGIVPVPINPKKRQNVLRFRQYVMRRDQNENHQGHDESLCGNTVVLT